MENPYKSESGVPEKIECDYDSSRKSCMYSCKRESVLMSICLYTVCFCITSIFAIEVIKEMKILVVKEIPINPYVIVGLSGISLIALFLGIGLSRWNINKN